jgi:hypothetical protein
VDELSLDEPPPPVMTRVPITTPIDQPVEVVNTIFLQKCNVEPKIRAFAAQSILCKA